MLPFPEAFEDQVRDCLGILYDFAKLHDHPIAVQLAGHLSGLERVQTVRQTLIDLIDELKLDGGKTFPSSDQRLYFILQMRYIELQSVQEVADELALGERHFYREHRRAIHAISLLLWQRLNSQTQAQVQTHTHASQAPRENSPESVDHISLESEVQLAYARARREPVELSTMIAGAVEAVRGLSERRAVAAIVEPCGPETFPANNAALRQTLIWLLSHVISAQDANSMVRIRCEHLNAQASIEIDVPRSGEGETRALEQDDALHNLLRVVNARLAVRAQPDHSARIALELMSEPRTVLIVDDNPDAIRLFERYVAESDFDVIAARDADEGVRLAREMQPDLIVLDVMLPGRDGWQALQQLKSHPVTRRIPILVCSVLGSSVPDLALSLGADGYLHKPPGRLEFLRALAQWGY